MRHVRVQNAAYASGEHAGCFGWCMFDYQTHKDFGSGDRICYHGVLDSFRNPKLAAAPVRCVEAASLYSGVQRWKTSAQGKLMPASTCTGYYLTQTFAGFAASPPSPAP